MTDLFQAPVRKTIAGKTAGQLLDDARIIETTGGLYLISCGDLELNLTDDYWMMVSGYGTALGQMQLTDDQCNKLIELEAEVERRYEAKMV